MVVKFGSAIVGACVVVATLTVAACQQVNEQINERTLACGEVPEEICVRLADDISAGFERRNPDAGRIVQVTVSAWDCPPGLPAVRCWHVEASTVAGGGSKAIYHQRGDGTLVH